MKPKFLSVGNVYLETVLVGTDTGGADKLSSGREYRSVRFVQQLGGSAVNFAAQMQALGESVSVVAQTGTDASGDMLMSLLNRLGIGTEYIRRNPEVQTGIDVGVVLSHSGQNIQLVSGDANRLLDNSCLDRAQKDLEGVTAVYFSGILKQDRLFAEYPRIIRNFKASGVRVFLDHGRIPVSGIGDKLGVLREIFPMLDCYLPNGEELSEVTGVSDLGSALQKVIKWGVRCCAVKLGASGCRIYGEGSDITVPGHKVDVVSPVGAGDIFNAVFVSTHLETGDIRTAAAFANAAAALRVSRGSYPTRQEITGMLK